MDKAKMKVGEFLHKSGKHDTTVHESVNPAVTHEVVKPHVEEHHTTAVDREVRQDHFHTSVQPIQDQQVKGEQHHIKDLGVEHKELRHGDDREIKERLAQEQAQFKNERHVGPTTTTQHAEPVVTGEHVHHNVHEVIQPVVHREVIEPHVVHSVAKRHEIHENAPQIHGTSTLPPVNMSEFKSQGGDLSGREVRTDAFGGEPRNVGGTGIGHSTDHHTSGHGTGLTGSHGTGHTGTHSSVPGTGHNTSGMPGTGQHTGTHGVPGAGHSGTHSGMPVTGHSGTHNTHDSSSTHEKPSLMDKLNPKKDASGDGKAGFMS